MTYLPAIRRALPSLTFLVPVVFLFSWAQSAGQQVSASSRDPTTIALTYLASPTPMFYQGDGGTTHKVNGIEFWDLGWPQKVYKVIGSVTAQLSGQNWGTPEQRVSLDSALAKLALEMKGDAVVPYTLPDEGQLKVWIIRYTNETPPGGMVLQHVDSVNDADGNVVPNGSLNPMRALRFADANDAMGPGTHGEGVAVVRVCINADGTSAETPFVVRSSGHRDVDEGAVREMMRSTFAPATAKGKPVRSCATVPFKYGS